MDNYVIKMQKKLRRGYTTGTCAAAASAAAVRELCYGVCSERIDVRLPVNETVSIPVFREEASGRLSEKPFGQSERPRAEDKNVMDLVTATAEGGVRYYVVKDSGDDPDVTNHIHISARASWIARREIPARAFRDPESDFIFLDGGEGVGRVTEPGLEQKVGAAAINKVPRKMIFESVRKNCCRESDGQEEALLVTISAENGAEIAKKTFNSQLGIVGGISILGTTGIVEPMSTRALIATIEVKTKQLINQDYRHLIYVPGNYGVRYVKNQLEFPEAKTIECSNYIGEAIDLAAGYGAKSVLIVGNFGKLVKLAAGIMNTHSRVADGRWEILVSHAALAGADGDRLAEIRRSLTTDQMLSVLYGTEAYEKVLASVMSEIDRHVTRRADQMEIGVMVFSEKYGFLGETSEAEKILEETRDEYRTE